MKMRGANRIRMHTTPELRCFAICTVSNIVLILQKIFNLCCYVDCVRFDVGFVLGGV